jgi:hypothetical protein
MIEYGRAVVYHSCTEADIERRLLREYREIRDRDFPGVKGDPEFLHTPPTSVMVWMKDGEPIGLDLLQDFHAEVYAAWKFLAGFPGANGEKEKSYAEIEKDVATQHVYELVDSGRQQRMSCWRMEVPDNMRRTYPKRLF